MIDYKRAAYFHKFYLLDGFNSSNMLRMEMRGDQSITTIEIDKSVWIQANELLKGIVTIKGLPLKTHYAANNTLIQQRLKTIEGLQLQDQKHLILILLTIAPWGLEQVEVNGESKVISKKGTQKQEAEEIREGAREVEQLFRLLQHENATVQNGIPSIMNEPLKWRFKSADITFYNDENTSTKNLRLPTNVKGSEIFAELMIDYMNDLLLGDVTIYDRIDMWKEHADRLESRPEQVKNPHYIFTYNFITFLENSTIYTKKSYSDNERYEVFLNLLSMTPYKMKGYDTAQNKISTIKGWNSKGKMLITLQSME